MQPWSSGPWDRPSASQMPQKTMSDSTRKASRFIKRLAEAGRLARENPRLPIVISGAKGMSRVVAELGGGIDSSRVLVETRSNNTYENALYSAEMIKPKQSERWLLVTGASHMPRAIGSFRRAGFEVEPWPVYDLTVSDSGLPNAFHEWLGLF